jgi:peptide deformylase
MYEKLKIIHWPDPRLLKPSRAVAAFDGDLKALISRMVELMRDHKGVGLAAPQVGVNLRLFVMNPTGQPADDRVYVNPALSDATGSEEGEEGCLSLPGINTKVDRSTEVRMSAQDADGRPIEQVGTGYIARIWQHETDHLNGIVLVDRMGPLAKLAARKTLKGLREEYEHAHPPAAKAPVRQRVGAGRR